MEFSQWKILEETEKSIKKFIRNLKGLWIAKKKRKEKKKNGRLTLFDFKTYYKAVVIKIILA